MSFRVAVGLVAVGAVGAGACRHAPTIGAPDRGVPAADFQAEVDRTYCFAPHELDDKQIDQRSGELDRFWKKLKDAPEVYCDPLRRELDRPGHRPFFYYDGGQLLLAMSNAPEDEARVLRALARVDIRDVQGDGYLRTVHRFAVKGLDTTAAAFKILDDPKFSAFIPAHVLKLGQNFCLVYMLLPAPEANVLPAVVERTRREKDETAKKSLLLVDFYLARPETDALIRETAKSKAESAAVKKYAASLVDQIDGASNTERSKAKLAGLPRDPQVARELRRERLKSISDEALIDLDLLTAAIRAGRPGKGGRP